MAIKKKLDLDLLANLTPEDKADLSALFDSVESNNAEIATLRKKTDSADAVVKKNGELEKLLEQKEKLSAELQGKLNRLTTSAPAPTQNETFDDLSPFSVIREMVNDLLGDDEETPAGDKE